MERGITCSHDPSFIFACFCCRLAVALICVAYPIYVIRRSGTRERANWRCAGGQPIRPVVTIIAAIAAVLATVGYWRAEAAKWRRALTAVGAALGWCWRFWARQVYELMFHRLNHPSSRRRTKSNWMGPRRWLPCGSAGRRGRTPYAACRTITWSTMWWAGPRSSRPIERSVTPVWCGGERSTACG